MFVLSILYTDDTAKRRLCFRLKSGEFRNL